MKNEENAIEVRDVTKTFKVYYDKGTELKEKLLFWKRNRYENRVVLDHISFEVKKGEAIGLVGKNGCGKSTTLKMLTRIIYPNSGEIEMTKKEIDERLEEIIAFSELEEFIDNPVRTYSSGMYTRLAFSVAINVDADILLIDEILAVGDANFQAKCFNKLREIKASGTTIVIVSHSLGQIEQICDRSIWICEGKIAMEGRPKEVHLEYLDYMNTQRIDQQEKERLRLQKLELQNMQAEEEKKRKAKMKRYGSEDAKFTQIRCRRKRADDVSYR